MIIFNALTLSSWFFIFFLLVSSIDGLQGWHQYSRILVVTVAGVACFVRFIYFEFLSEEYEIETAIFGRLSINGRAANAAEILALFLGKQAVNTVFKGKDQCTVVRYYPFIQWRKPL